MTTAGPINSAASLGGYVETLLRKSSSEFNATISQINGQSHPSHSTHAFNVGKMRIKLCRRWITKSREMYSTSMLLCEVRDVGVAARHLSCCFQVWKRNCWALYLWSNGSLCCYVYVLESVWYTIFASCLFSKKCSFDLPYSFPTVLWLLLVHVPWV